MNNIPFLSIIIPVYNTEKYLRECLDSLLSQTFEDWEAICVDDGSTDSSGAILDEYANKDSRFRVVHKTNEGVSVARNVGLDIALGTYIGFADADDVVSADWLSSVSDTFDSSRADMVKTRYRRDFNFDSYHKIDAYRTYEGKDIYEWSVLKGGMPWMNFYRRECLKDVKFPEGMRIYEDGIFNLYALLNIRIGAQCEYDGYGYRLSETSSFKKRITEDEYVRLIEECSGWFCKASERLKEIGATKVALTRIKEYIGGRILEWVRQPDSTRGEKTKIASAVRRAEKDLHTSLSPDGLIRGMCCRAYYSYNCFALMRMYSLIARLKKRLQRALHG